MNSRKRLPKAIEEAKVEKGEQVYNVFALLWREEGHVDAEQ
jgi:hypothetical protein